MGRRGRLVMEKVATILDKLRWHLAQQAFARQGVPARRSPRRPLLLEYPVIPSCLLLR